VNPQKPSNLQLNTQQRHFLIKGEEAGLTGHELIMYMQTGKSSKIHECDDECKNWGPPDWLHPTLKKVDIFRPKN